MSQPNLEDHLLGTLVRLAEHHGDHLQRNGNCVQTPDGRISLGFNNIQFGERAPGNFVILATVQITAPSTGLTDLYDSILESGPNPEVPLQHAVMGAFHLLKFVQNALQGSFKPVSTLALANAEGTRSFNVYFYGPILRANGRETTALIEKKLGDAWAYKKVFAAVPSALTRYKPYWVKVNHLKAGDTNIPECRLDEREWLEVQSQIATFQWPLTKEMMGYKQFFIFMPSGWEKNPA